MELTTADIQAARQKAGTIDDYIDSMSKLYRWKFLQRRDSYRPKQKTLGGIKELAEKYFILAFSSSPVFCAVLSSFSAAVFRESMSSVFMVI